MRLDVCCLIAALGCGLKQARRWRPRRITSKFKTQQPVCVGAGVDLGWQYLPLFVNGCDMTGKVHKSLTSSLSVPLRLAPPTRPGKLTDAFRCSRRTSSAKLIVHSQEVASRPEKRENGRPAHENAFISHLCNPCRGCYTTGPWRK